MSEEYVQNGYADLLVTSSLVLFLWTSELLMAFTILSISIACSLWYFSHHPMNRVSSVGESISRVVNQGMGGILSMAQNIVESNGQSITKPDTTEFTEKGLLWATIYHMGSLCFGSLLLTICQVIRYIMEQASRDRENQNLLAQCLLCMGQCLVRCLEDLIRHISKTAYMVMGLTGEDFCKENQKFNLF